MLAALAGATVVLVLAGGVAWAAIPGPDGVIQGCYDSGGNVKVVQALPCPRNYTPFSWNAQGVPGSQGIQGIQGPPGQNGTNGADGVSPVVSELAPGDPNCAAGGAAITDAAGTTAYACNGQNGEDGADGEPFSGTFTSPNGEYELSVTDAGVTLSHGPNVRIELIGDDVLVRGMDVEVRAALKATLKGAIAEVDAGATASVHAGGMTTVQGGQVQVKGGGACLPAARVNDVVVVTGPGFAPIVTGAPTVCIG
jgi:hypothetical protein